MQDETSLDPGRPEPDEYNPYYEDYVQRVPKGAIAELLAKQLNTTLTLLTPLSPAQTSYRPKPEDWNIIEVMGHLADSERVFAYRALRFARNDTTPLSSFDQDLFVANANFAHRSLIAVLGEFAAVRQATLALLRGFDEAAWLRRGTANKSEVSVRALAYIIAGHELHHIADFRQRYQIG